MKRGTFPASLYGRTPKTLCMTKVIPTLRAVILDPRRIRCGALFVNDPHPIKALCQALLDSGREDCAVQVWSADRAPAFLIASFTATARSGAS